MDGNERDPCKQLGPDKRPVKLTPGQEDKILDTALNGFSDKKIKPLIKKFGSPKNKRHR